MKLTTILALLFILTLTTGFSSTAYAQEIPAWVKGVADWWVKGNISDDEFLEAIEFLIKQDFISIDEKLLVENDTKATEKEIPTIKSQVKENDNYYDDYDDFYNDNSDDNYNDTYDNQFTELDGWDAQEFIMSPEDCYDFEKYDVEEKMCYSECSTDEECKKLDKLISSMANDIWDDSSDVYDDTPTKQSSDNSQSDAETALASYSVSGNKITLVTSANTVSPSQEDITKHNELWKLFTKLIPLENRVEVALFNIFTDGPDGTLAAVERTSNNQNWILLVDLVDAYKNDILDKKDVEYSLIHEYSHILTANTSQVDVFDGDTGTCASTYQTTDGCAKSDSYLNKFVNEFWSDIYPEFERIQNIQSDNAYDAAMERFVTLHQSKFLTEYAATSPDEDISESFTAFVLKDKPTGITIQDEKILFFYEYTELVVLRDFIRSNL